MMQERVFDEDDDFFMIKKINEADDGSLGHKYIIIKTKSLKLINQQLQHLVYRAPVSDTFLRKLNRNKATDTIRLSLNEEYASQEVKIPVWVEEAKVATLNLNT